MTNIPRRRLIPLAAVLIAGLVGCGMDGSVANRKEITPVPDNAAVEVKEVRFDALNEAVKEYKGKFVLMDYWATWCGPCVAKFPHFVQLHEKYKDRGLVCVSVSMNKWSGGEYKQKDVLDFLKRKGAAFPNFVMIDPEADEKMLTQRFGLGDGIPYMALLDTNGNVRWNSDTKLTDEQLDKLIEEHLPQ